MPNPVFNNAQAVLKDGFVISIDIRGLSFSNPDGDTPGLDQQLGIVFQPPMPCEILWVSEAHTNAGTGTIGLQNQDGSNILKSDFALNTAINTPQSKKGYNNLQNTVLKAGEFIKTVGSGLTETQNINITIYLKWLGKGDYATP